MSALAAKQQGIALAAFSLRHSALQCQVYAERCCWRDNSTDRLFAHLLAILEDNYICIAQSIGMLSWIH